MKDQFVVLLSGGLDSSVNLFEAQQNGKILLVLSFNYGQKAAVKEIEAAKNLCNQLNLKLKTIELPWFQDFGRSSLIVKEKDFPKNREVDILDPAKSLDSARSVWVPNRNGIFLNIAAGFAEALGANAVVPGFNVEEAETFPDNSQDFMNALDKSFHFSTANQVKVKCFTSQMNKSEILSRAVELKVPLNKIWPCYDAKQKWCGVCESCLRAKRAFLNNKIEIANYFLE